MINENEKWKMKNENETDTDAAAAAGAAASAAAPGFTTIFTVVWQDAAAEATAPAQQQHLCWFHVSIPFLSFDFGILL